MSISSQARLCWVVKRLFRSSGDHSSVFVTYFYGNSCFWLKLPYFHTNASFTEWDVFANLGSSMKKTLAQVRCFFLPNLLCWTHLQQLFSSVSRTVSGNYQDKLYCFSPSRPPQKINCELWSGHSVSYLRHWSVFITNRFNSHRPFGSTYLRSTETEHEMAHQHPHRRAEHHWLHAGDPGSMWCQPDLLRFDSSHQRSSSSDTKYSSNSRGWVHQRQLEWFHPSRGLLPLSQREPTGRNQQPDWSGQCDQLQL